MVRKLTIAGVRSSLRFLFADIIGDDGDGSLPLPPPGLPEPVAAIARAGIDRLVHYQGIRYARLYVDRLQRFAGRRGIDAALLGEIARLMAIRMSYDDAIRMAQLKLTEAELAHNTPGTRAADDIRRLRLDELVGALPAMVADPVLGVLEWLGWLHKPVTMRFSIATAWSARRLKLEAATRRWRLKSVRYAGERVWVERWLHMIDRSLTKQPQAAAEVVQTAALVHGYGDGYRKGLADWHFIIDSLVKPSLDGTLQLPDLAAAVAQARAIAATDSQGLALRKFVADIKARVTTAAAG